MKSTSEDSDQKPIEKLVEDIQPNAPDAPDPQSRGTVLWDAWEDPVLLSLLLYRIHALGV